jgi:hypothetical protein
LRNSKPDADSYSDLYTNADSYCDSYSYGNGDCHYYGCTERDANTVCDTTSALAKAAAYSVPSAYAVS